MTSLHTEPAARVRALVEKAGTCDVDGEIPFRRYYRSGLEMERMVRPALFLRLIMLTIPELVGLIGELLFY